MAENVGAIVWTAEMETSSLLSATNDIVKAADKAGVAFTDMEKKTLKLSGATDAISYKYQAATKTLNEYIAQQTLLGREVTKNGTVLDANGNEVTDVTQKLKSLTTEADKAATVMNKMNTSSMNVSKTSQAVSKATKGLGANLGMAGIQVQQFVGQLQGGQSALLALSQQGADLGFVLGYAGLGAAIGIAATAFSFLLPLLTTASTDVEELKKRIEELGDSTEKTVAQIRFLAQENDKAIDGISKRNEKLTKSIIEKEKQLEKMTTAGTGLDEGQFAIPRSASQNQEKYAESITKVKKSLVELRADIDTNNQEMVKLNESTTKLADSNDKLVEKTKSVSDSLKGQIIALEDGEKAALMYGIAQQLQLKAGEKIPGNIQTQVDKLYELKAAKEAAAEQDKKNLEMARSIARFESDQEKEKEKRARDSESASNFASGIVTRDDDTFEQLAADLDKLQELRDQDLITQEEYRNAQIAIDKQAADELKAINDEKVANEIATQSLMLSAASGLFGNLAELTAAFGDEQSNAYKAMFALSKGFAIAQAGLNLSLAISQASKLPYPTNLPAMAQAASAGGSLVSAISGAQYGGGRRYGGNVSNGNYYEVNEGGLPELYESGGKQYLMPNSDGKVVSNKDATSGAGAPIVNVNIQTPVGMTASVTSTENGNNVDINATIKAVANNIKSGGSVYSAIQQTTKAGSKIT